jgi:hypothetical protein
MHLPDFWRSLVPVIVAFTKVDRLEFKEQKRIKRQYLDQGMPSKEALQRAKAECIAAAAEEYEKCCVAVLQSDLVPPAWTRYCAVSNKRELHFILVLARPARVHFQAPNR